MKLYKPSMVLVAIIAAFFLGGIINISKPIIGLLIVAAAAILISYGYFIGKGNN